MTRSSNSLHSKVEKYASRYSTKTLQRSIHLKKVSAEEVQSLDLWHTGEDPKCRQELEELERTFRLKQTHQDEVEKQLKARRGKQKLPAVNAKPITDLQGNLTERRLEVRANDTITKEKHRFSRAYEDDLEAVRLRHLADLEEITQSRESLRKEISKTRQRLIEMALELDREKVLAQRREDAEKKTAEYKELAKFFYRKNTLRQSIEDKTKQYQAFKASLDEKLSHSVLELETLDDKVHRVKQNLELIKRTQVHNYLQILKAGRDTRNAGLLWVVKALWDLNFKVKPKHFPSFLEDETVEKIFELARMSCELADLQKEVDYESAHNRRSSRSKDRWNGIKERLKNLKSNIYGRRRPVNIDLRSRKANVIWTSLANDLKPRLFREEHHEVMASLESQLALHKERMNSLKDTEIERLTHAFFMSNYEKRYGVDLKTLLSCIVGAEFIDRVLASANKEHAFLSEQLIQSKTYRFSKSPEVK
jgi:hypothetical protein